MADSSMDLRSLEDDDYQALLEFASRGNYKKTTSTNNGEDLAFEKTDGSKSTDQPSRKAQQIFADLKEKADRDTCQEDEAINTRFVQKKLGKSASHESCQPKSLRTVHNRHSAFGSLDVDARISSSLFASIGGNFKANSRSSTSRSVTASLPSTDLDRCGCRSPGAVVDSRDSGYHYQRGLNRSYSSTGSAGYWVSSIKEGKDHSRGSGDGLDGESESCNTDLHCLAKSNLNSDQSFNDAVRDGAKYLEMDAIRRHFDTSFISSALIGGRSYGAKRRSNSQRGHSYRRQMDDPRSPTGESADECDRMTRSEFGFISGRSPPRLRTRRKRVQQEDVQLSHQMNGYQGYDKLEDILARIEGEEASKKSINDQHTKKIKKKTTPESNPSNNGGNGAVPTNGNPKKEKVRRLTEGDNGKFGAPKAALEEDNLSYKHRSTDSLELSYKEDANVPFMVVGKSMSAESGIETKQHLTSDSTEAKPNLDTFIDPTLDGDASLAKALQMEESKEAAVFDNVDPNSEVVASSGGDDEQFIPVTNKKKKNRAEQFRATATPRYGRSSKVKALSDAQDKIKRSVTPPARGLGIASGRRRRNSLDDSRVGGDVATPGSNDQDADSVGQPSKLSTTADSSIPATSPDNAELIDAKLSYARVAAAHRQTPTLGDYVTNKSRFRKNGNRRYQGSKDDHTMKDVGDGSGQTPRQSSSLNASRSSSPVNIPTAVATNLANASSPDLKHFTGDFSYSGIVAQGVKRTYATIAAEKRAEVNAKPISVSCADPNVSKSIVSPSTVVLESSTHCVVPTINASQKSGVDMAVNTEPMAIVLEESTSECTFVFQASSTGSTATTRKSGERSSCSGAFDASKRPFGGNSSSSDAGEIAELTSPVCQSHVNRERRNSCPVQFLDKGGASLDAKSVDVSGLNFVYGDEDDTEEISAALARSATIDLPQTVAAALDVGHETNDHICTPVSMAHTENRLPYVSLNPEVVDKIPDKFLRAMTDFVNKAWKEFTRDMSPTIYYNCGGK